MTGRGDRAKIAEIHAALVSLRAKVDVDQGKQREIRPLYDDRAECRGKVVAQSSTDSTSDTTVRTLPQAGAPSPKIATRTQRRRRPVPLPERSSSLPGERDSYASTALGEVI